MSRPKARAGPLKVETWLPRSVFAFLDGALKRETERKREDERDPDRQGAEARRFQRGSKVVVNAPPEQEQEHVGFLPTLPSLAGWGGAAISPTVLAAQLVCGR